MKTRHPLHEDYTKDEEIHDLKSIICALEEKNKPNTKEMKKIEYFLKRNGFKRVDKGSYANESCNVVFEENETIAVADNNGIAIYSKDRNIYWLIGVLTYYNLMARNYTN